MGPYRVIEEDEDGNEVVLSSHGLQSEAEHALCWAINRGHDAYLYREEDNP